MQSENGRSISAELARAQSSNPFQELSIDPDDGAPSSSGPRIVVHEPSRTAATAETVQRSPRDLSRAQSSDESYSSTRESLNLEDVAHRQFAYESIPTNIGCTLYTTCDGSAISLVDFKVPYDDSSSYQTVEDIAQEHVKLECAESLSGKSLNFKYGNCTIIGENVEKIGVPLTTKDDWRDVCTILTNYWASDSQRTFHLDIFRDFFSFRSRATSDVSFASIKRSEIQRLMKKASDGRKYIPRTALMRFTSPHNIREIIIRDPRLNLEAKDKEEFIQTVQQRSSCLLAMCVYADLRMDCLRELLAKKCSDATFPLEDHHCCHLDCEPNFENLLRNQGGFKTAQFDIIGQHQDFDSDVVIPFHYLPVDVDEEDFIREGRQRESDEDTFNTQRERDLKKRRACCGSGAYSNVFRVRIDPEHHRLSKHKDRDFALKEFKDRPQRGDADFKQELKVLEKLREYPHKHIVTHLATWTQDGKYYMLFPYAQCNLRQYMKWMQFGTPTKGNIIWLLEQLRGLGEALKDIHNLSRLGLSTLGSSPAPNLSAPQQQMRESGWHHDLKPENILLYKTRGSRRGTFQISDFGSSKIHTYRSGSINTRSPNGTLTYEPPEAKSEGATSRPYDVWSLGCVFLELLIWAILGPDSVEKFGNERLDRRYPGSKTDAVFDDSYWQMTQDGAITVRNTVLQRIEILHRKVTFQPQQPFEAVLKLILRMLDPNRRTRILALDVWNTLDNIYNETTLDLQNINDDALPEGKSDGPPSLLPRLSLNPIDRLDFDSPRNGSIPSNPNLMSITGEFLSASPIDTRMQRRNSFGSTTSATAASPPSRNPSIASSNMSTHGRYGSVDGREDLIDDSH